MRRCANVGANTTFEGRGLITVLRRFATQKNVITFATIMLTAGVISAQDSELKTLVAGSKADVIFVH